MYPRRATEREIAALSVRRAARNSVRAASAMVLLAGTLAIAGCAGGAASSSAIQSGAPKSSFAGVGSQQPLPPEARAALTDFVVARGLKEVEPRTWHVDFGPRAGSAWIADFGSSICLIGGPDSESSVACFDGSAVATGEAVSVLLGGKSPRDRSVTVFGLTPGRAKSVRLEGGSGEGCDFARGIFSCTGTGSDRIVYTTAAGDEFDFKLPLPGVDGTPTG